MGEIDYDKQTKEQLEKDFEELKEYNSEGITAAKYLELMRQNEQIKQEMLYSSAKRNFTLSLIHYLDDHRRSGRMCFSSIECADLEKAFIEEDWSKIIKYICKHLGLIDIDKAYEWFQYNAWSFGYNAQGDSNYDWEMALKCFLTAMEK